uniref:Reverse transcriptase domain-containing protein n=1 Tax=Oreochromis niloticus TaxID=8128 RepID=A0A669D0H5_ORENI
MLASQLRGFQAKEHITKIRMANGNITSEPSKINDKFRAFYSQLYASEFPQESTLMDNFLKTLNVPMLSSDSKNRLDEPIRPEELGAAIASLQPGKSPGPDGFPVEFFKAFSPLLLPQLHLTLSDSWKCGKLPPSFYEASIALVPKKGKDPVECSSYRPISLLNVDAKILAKVLARRLENILPSVISEDQTGFIKNRYSYSNIRRLLDILYTPSSQSPECILSLDAEKAFDWVEWKYLFTVLDKFNFGSKFISWIRLLYMCPNASVFTNSIQSQPFNFQRGTRQGCPLSPLLFNLAIEPLAIALRSCGEINGIWRKGVEHKVSLYADDLLIFISNPKISLPAMLSILRQFGQFSGYKLNLYKSELFPVDGGAPVFDYTTLPFKIAGNQFTYLGVIITRKHNCLFKANLLPLLNNTKKHLAQWSPLSTSLVGRINSIKMNILPKFLYLFQLLPVFIPKSFFDSLDSIISSYIWRGKRPQLDKAQLQKPKSRGGLALSNFRYYYWAANMRYIISWLYFHNKGNCPSWVLMELNSATGSSVLALIGSSLPLPPNKTIDNPVVWHTVRVWAQMRKHFGLTGFSLLSPIFSNPFFQPSLSDPIFRDWHDRGITCFNDLFFDNTFASFAQLSEKFNLPRTHLFRYLQTRQFLQSQIPNFPVAPDASPGDMLLTLIPTRKGFISLIYDRLVSMNGSSIDRIKTAWEQDLNQSLSMDTWDLILKLVNSTSLCARHCLLQFKVVHRFHLSKVKLSRMYPNVDPICDKCGSAEASLIHMFWTCPSLEGFWTDIFQTLSLIIGHHMDPDPLVALFGTTGEADARLTSSQRCMLSFASLVARHAILLRWRGAPLPTQAQWLRGLMYYLSLEKIRYAISNNSGKFYKVWGQFLKYFSSLQVANPASSITQ